MLQMHAGRVRNYFLLLPACIAFSAISAISNAQTLVLNDTSGPPFTTPDGTGFFDILVGRAFKMAGLTLKLVRTPPERALLNANAGIDDGELARIKGIDITYKNLVRVPEKLIDWNFVALTRNPDIMINGWNDLRKYNIGYIRGWKILENNTIRHPKVSVVRSRRELFSMLDKNRIDIALYSKWMGLDFVKKNNIKGVRVLEPPLAKREMYIYLHIKNSAHVVNIANALKEMKENGEYKKMFKQKIFQPYKK